MGTVSTTSLLATYWNTAEHLTKRKQAQYCSTTTVWVRSVATAVACGASGKVSNLFDGMRRSTPNTTDGNTVLRPAFALEYHVNCLCGTDLSGRISECVRALESNTHMAYAHTVLYKAL